MPGWPAQCGKCQGTARAALQPLAPSAGQSLLAQPRGWFIQFSAVCCGAGPVPRACGLVGASWLAVSSQCMPGACAPTLLSRPMHFPQQPDSLKPFSICRVSRKFTPGPFPELPVRGAPHSRGDARGSSPIFPSALHATQSPTCLLCGTPGTATPPEGNRSHLSPASASDCCRKPRWPGRAWGTLPPAHGGTAAGVGMGTRSSSRSPRTAASAGPRGVGAGAQAAVPALPRALPAPRPAAGKVSATPWPPPASRSRFPPSTDLVTLHATHAGTPPSRDGVGRGSRSRLEEGREPWHQEPGPAP